MAPLFTVETIPKSLPLRRAGGWGRKEVISEHELNSEFKVRTFSIEDCSVGRAFHYSTASEQNLLRFFQHMAQHVTQERGLKVIC